MEIIFDTKAVKNQTVEKKVTKFVAEYPIELDGNKCALVIYQDSKSKSYFVKCQISAENLASRIDFDARLTPEKESSYRANRELLLNHTTFKKMVEDATSGRSFHDIIVEYNDSYSKVKALKIWGGQHRLKAIEESYDENSISENHGLRVYFNLSKEQRTDLALISNTNISVSNDLFDRALEETKVGTNLREWCIKTGLLNKNDDFPDVASKSEKISVKLARTFIVNFFMGKKKAEFLDSSQLDKNIYEPYLCESGAELDKEYQRTLTEEGDEIWNNKDLESAGRCFGNLHKKQNKAVKENNKIANRKGYRNKAFTASVLSAWSFSAGLLQKDEKRMKNLYNVPTGNKDCLDPLNCVIMSEFKHESDSPTYRGLGTRSSTKDRQRMVQVFLAKSSKNGQRLTKVLLTKAVNQVVGIEALSKGYN